MEPFYRRRTVRPPSLLLVAALVTSFPAQARDIWVPSGAVWRYLEGTDQASSLSDSWRERGFDDGAWESGAAPLGYGEGSEGTVLEDMRDGYTSLFLRRAFDVTGSVDGGVLRLRVDYDDGFIAWINGARVLSCNAPVEPGHDGLAPQSHESGTFELYTLDDISACISPGANVLAVQVFNSSRSSSDLHLDLELSFAMPVESVELSRARGFCSSPFALALFTATPGAHIRYTTDGSAPSETYGQLYDGSISIERTTVLRAIAFKEGMEASAVATHTYLFLADALTQGEAPPGYPESWGETDADYAMDPRIVRDPVYGSLMERALLSLPALSIVMDRDDMFGPDGIYRNGGSGENQEWERPASVELVHPDRTEGFQIDCAIRPHSHVAGPIKRSFKLLLKSEYGPAKLRYPLFGSAPLNADSAADSFDRIILRAGLNRCWVNRWNPGDTCYTRDQWVRDTQIAMNGIGSHGIFVHLYINGLYWGLYNPVERPDAWFTSEYLGGEKEDWFAINHAGTVSGDDAVYDRLRLLVDEGDVGDAQGYAEAGQLLDLGHFCDYLILNWYAGTGDWPNNNWYGGNRAQPPGRFLYFCWDAEDVFDALGSGRVGRSNDGAWVHPEFRGDATSDRRMAMIWHALRQNADFRCLFADRVYRHCFNRGALTEEKARARWWALNESIELAVIGESARWGDAREADGDPVRTRDDDWLPEVERVSSVSLAGNVDRFVSALREEGYYPSLDPPRLLPHGGLVFPGSGVIMDGRAGSAALLYTLDGSDPRVPGSGAVASECQVYSSPVSIERTTTIKARLRSAHEWSALAEATFYVPQDFAKLRFTELMYHFPDIGGVENDRFEFLELKNVGLEPLDLSGLRFTQGISFEFPPGATLGPSDLAVLASDREAFAQLYPGVAVLGTYDRDLSDRGEAVVLRDGGGDVILGVTYDDEAPWPEEPDGDGFSLVPVSATPGGDPNDPARWRASREPWGSPGRDDGPEVGAAPWIQEHPRDVRAAEGGRAAFWVLAPACPLPSYQWQREGRDLPGENAWILIVPSCARADDRARYRCVVSNVHGSATSMEARLMLESSDLEAHFVRGDSNGDESVDISDAVHMLLVLFAGVAADSCDDSRDTDDDGALTLTDPVALLGYLFGDSPAPPSPFPSPGSDPTPEDGLACRRASGS